MTLTIHLTDREPAGRLERAALDDGSTPSALARDLIAIGLSLGPRAAAPIPRESSPKEAARRNALLEELRALRAMTERPLHADSALTIREMRDSW